MLLSNFTGLCLHFLCPADDDNDEEKEKEAKAEEKTAAEASMGGETSVDNSPPTSTSGGKGVSSCIVPCGLWLSFF